MTDSVHRVVVERRQWWAARLVCGAARHRGRVVATAPPPWLEVEEVSLPGSAEVTRRLAAWEG